MSRKQLTIGIFGFGCVGQGLYEALNRSGSVPASVKRICIKHADKERNLPAHFFTTNAQEILGDPEIDVVIELIDDADAAYTIVTEALKRGKAVVSANKRLLAEHFEELVALQRETGAPFLYEGAACASIPIIRNLEEYYDNELVRGIEGIFNGSSNFILSQIFKFGKSYREALAEAQELGFAETDPSLDVDGWDAAFKLSILSAHAFGQRIPAEDILRFGIANFGAPELQFANEKGWRLKLVAKASRVGERLFGSVLPRFVTPEDPLYHVEDEYNGVLLESAFSDIQFFKGKGAGSLPTGSAVLSDLSALGYDYRYEYRKLKDGYNYWIPERKLRVYIRYVDPATIAGIRFEEIEESYRNQRHHYVTGTVSARELQAFLKGPDARDAFVAELPVRSEQTVPSKKSLPAVHTLALV